MTYDAISVEAYKILKKGAAVFNEWRLGNLETRINFSERIFLEQEFSDYLFINVDFTKTSFEGSVLNNVVFSASNLEQTDLYGIVAHNTVFGVPELINTQLDERIQQHLTIPAQLQQPNFMMADLTGATFRETNLKGANFHRAFLEFVDFRNTNYKEADFSGARLGKTLFTE